jgi:hypothetical protein
MIAWVTIHVPASINTTTTNKEKTWTNGTVFHNHKHSFKDIASLIPHQRACVKSSTDSDTQVLCCMSLLLEVDSLAIQIIYFV